MIMMLQTFIIGFLFFWIYQEYQYNPYFQSYVNGYLQGDSLITLSLVSIGSFTAVAIGLYAKLHGTKKELETILSAETARPKSQRPVRGIDSRTEQHLIEMIRKTTPVLSSGTTDSGQTPVLRRTDQESST